MMGKLFRKGDQCEQIHRVGQPREYSWDDECKELWQQKRLSLGKSRTRVM